MRILVVDDNRVNQILMRGLLEKLGCEISIASDGPDAISRTDREAFDLVLMDIDAGMDGFETTARIRLKRSRDE
ncbi:MAG: response regulator [Planctomycetaceae bacterium]